MVDLENLFKNIIFKTEHGCVIFLKKENHIVGAGSLYIGKSLLICLESLKIL